MPRSRSGDANRAPSRETSARSKSVTRRPSPGQAPPPEPDEPALRRSFLWWGRLAFVTAGLFFLIQLLLFARGVVEALLQVILYVVFGAVLALVCGPLVGALERRARLPRTLATLLSLAGVVAALAGIIYLVAEPLVGEARSLTAALPRLTEPLGSVQSWLSQHGINAGGFNAAPLLGSGSGWLGGVLMSAVTGVFAVAVGIVVVLVTAFWMLRDHRVLRQGLLQSMPVGWRHHAEFVLEASAVVVGGYVRAQLSLALLVGALAGAGCAVIGVPYPIVVGVLTTLFELVPLVGPFAGAAVGGLLALTQSPVMLLETLGLFLVIHIIEGYLVAPRLQGRFVRLHPLVAFLSLLAGIEVAGLLGGLFAVPATSLAAVIIRATIGDWRANRPELFVPLRDEERDIDRELVGRRRSLLREYRLFKTPPRPAERARRFVRSGKVRRYAPGVIAVAALVALVVSADPLRVAGAVGRFPPLLIPAVLAVSLGFYVLQGARWWTLLHAGGIRVRFRDTILVTLAGQTTAMLPLGELTRSILLSRIANVGLGSVVATETVQELLFVGLLFAAAIPGALHYRTAAIAIIAATAIITLIVVMLCVDPLYHWLRNHVVVKVPLLRRIVKGVDELQVYCVRLFTDHRTYTWLWISVVQAVLAISLLWLVIQGVAPGVIGWDQAALVYAVTQGASWVSMSPGGLGAFELSTAGFLVALGLPYSSGTAAAILFRLADKGVATVVGFVCFLVMRKHFHLSGVNILKLRQSGGQKQTAEVA